MRTFLTLLLGILTGALIAVGFVVFNPLAAQQSLSPLSVSDRAQLSFNYSATAEDAIVYTNDGESRVKPHPGKVLQLWEPPIRNTDMIATVLHDGRGLPVGFGVKFMSKSERTNLLNGEALVDSAWHVYLPEAGTMVITQTENYWGYLRDVVVPAHWSSSDSWRGNWHGTLTAGPNALGTARVHGGVGDFAGSDFEAIERRSAQAYSTERGPVAMSGQLIVELPDEETLDSGLETAEAANR